ncbi:MAG: TonB-dependent receptor, partial [Bdellovibrionales bacterium]|nr:TonB-dependent receptor [Bdellovibrionales bacterium]
MAQNQPNEALNVQEIQVMGFGGRSTEFNLSASVSALTGKRLDRKKQATVGETLSRELGVNSSFFGPGASRPIIRGLDGERIRILQNGIGTMDASGTSPDHAVSIDPLTVRQFEIVRGSSALKYGSSAVGGVVNMVTDRIPTTLLGKSETQAQLRASTVDLGRSLGVKTNISLPEWVIHADFSGRRAERYQIPGFARTSQYRALNPLPAGEAEPEHTVPGSQQVAMDGSLGATRFFSTSLLGANLSTFNSEYGVVSEQDVQIHLSRQRADALFEGKNFSWAKLLRVKSGYSQYRHEEIASGKVETLYKNRGHETRVELHHNDWGPVHGEFGVHHQSQRLEVEGDEAFLPTTQSATSALYLTEELQGVFIRPNWGLRGEWTAIESSGGAAFGAGETKSFGSASGSIGINSTLGGSANSPDGEQTLFLNATLTQRPPNGQELFASGAHVATATFENGNRNLGLEHGLGLEVGLRTRSELGLINAVAFVQQFSNYIALTPTGTIDAGSSLPIFNFEASKAQLSGAEAELRRTLFRASENPWLGSGIIDLELKADVVQGWNTEKNIHLPRISPIRSTAAFIWSRQEVNSELEIQRSEHQALVAPGETETGGYWQVNVGFD